MVSNKNLLFGLLIFIILLNSCQTLILTTTPETSIINAQTENESLGNVSKNESLNEVPAVPAEKINESGRHLTYINETEFYKNKTRSFSACYGFECFTPTERRGQASIDYFKSLNLTDDFIYVIIQFDASGGDPTVEQMNLLANDNILLFEYHGDHSYYAKAPRAILETKAYDFVRWVGIAENEGWKVERNLRNKTFGKNCTGDIQLDINFYQNIQEIPSYNNKKDLIMNLSLNLIGEYREIISVNASVTNIYKIASFNFVQMIEGTPIARVLGGYQGFKKYPDPLEEIKCYD
ncbi:hypothetical protein HYY70_04600 [Candidatus Woesearchaeota archaeon]|nr:hypothetical protein [Candidatus Woesearchaeota archaeon]